MFGLKIISKTEHLLWLGTIADLKKEIAYWKDVCEAERRRAEAAINLVLIKKAGAVITGDKTPTNEDLDAMFERADPFGDADRTEKDKKERQMMERLQS